MAQENYDTLKHEIDGLRSDISAISKTLKDIGADGRDGAAQRVRETFGAAQDTARRAARQTAAQVEERPLVSLAGAFGIGMMVGTLLNRRS